MLSFKQYVGLYFTEAKASHFTHIQNFDENNPEHKDLVSAFNKSGAPTKDAAKHKTLDSLSAAVKPHLDTIHKERQQEHDDREAFANKDVELVHHNPETGLKVFKVHNQRGSCAVGHGAKWCTANRDMKEDMVRKYDPSGENTHIIHIPKESGNLSKISINNINHFTREDGIKTGQGGNFQDKGNVSISKEKWDELRQKHGLDHVPALAGIRGIPRNKEQEKSIERSKQKLQDLKNPNSSQETINKRLTDEDPNVRLAAANHPNASEHNINKALDNQDHSVRIAAANHPNASEHNINKALDDKRYDVRQAAITNSNANSSHIDKAVKDTDWAVRKAAIQHKNSTSQQIKRVLDDENDEVKDEAKNQLKLKNSM